MLATLFRLAFLTLLALGSSDLGAQASTPAEPRPSVELLGAPSSLTRNVGLVERELGRWLGGGADYRARFDERGLRFEPALGRALERTQHLALRLESITRGGVALDLAAASAPSARGTTGLAYERAPGVEERHELTPAGVELSYAFEHELGAAGELVVRLALDTSLPVPALGEARDLLFARADTGGVAIGAVTGIDALGQKADGSLRLVPGALELVLPAPFVDAATWPLVLDPLVGTSFGVSTGTDEDVQPDAAYSAASDVYLVVWQRSFSATDSDILGQHVDAQTGALRGATLLFNSDGAAEYPHVASIRTFDHFLVTWKQVEGDVHSMHCESVRAAASQTANVVELLRGEPMGPPDVGGDGYERTGVTSGAALLVYHAPSVSEIRGMRVTVDAQGAISAGPSFSIVDGEPPSLPFLFFEHPRIASSCGVHGRFLMVHSRPGPVSAVPWSIEGVVLDIDGTIRTDAFRIASDPQADLHSAAVEGFDLAWNVAFSRTPTLISFTHVRMCAVRHSIESNDCEVGSSGNVSSYQWNQFTGDAVIGYSTGKSFVGYRFITPFPPTPSGVTMRAFDPQSCEACESAVALAPTPQGESEQRIALTTSSSGGLPEEDRGLAVWSVWLSGTGQDIQAQLFTNAAGVGGALQDLGGGCGNGGTPTFTKDGAPSIGTSSYVFGLNGLPSDATVSVLNISTGAVPLSCGPCVWNPFQITSSSLVVGGAASQARVIPCDPDLIGLQFQTQWTTLTPTSSGCSLFSGFSISDRTRVTIGS